MSRRVALVLGLAVALGIAAIVIWNQWQSGRNSAAGARLERHQAGAALDSGKDAINAVAASQGNFGAIDEITRENSDAIDKAPGARGPVDAGVHGAGLDGLCRRAAYRGSEQCVQRAAAGGMGKAGPGR